LVQLRFNWTAVKLQFKLQFNYSLGLVTWWFKLVNINNYYYASNLKKKRIDDSPTSTLSLVQIFDNNTNNTNNINDNSSIIQIPLEWYQKDHSLCLPSGWRSSCYVNAFFHFVYYFLKQCCMYSSSPFFANRIWLFSHKLHKVGICNLLYFILLRNDQ